MSTLEALAYNLIGRNCTAVSVMDARCNQVYCAIFNVQGETVTRLTEDMALKIDDLGELLKSYENIIFVGDGAKLCNKALGCEKAPANCEYQRGSSVCFAAVNHMDEALDSKELLPVYLRLPQAERELKAKQNK